MWSLETAIGGMGSALDRACTRLCTALVPSAPPLAPTVGAVPDVYVPPACQLSPEQLARAHAHLAGVRTALTGARGRLAEHDARRGTLETRRDICCLLALLSFALASQTIAFFVICAPAAWLAMDLFKRCIAHDAQRPALEREVLGLEADAIACDRLLHGWAPQRPAGADGAAAALAAPAAAARRVA